MRNHRITLVLTLSLLLLAEAVFACDIAHVKYRDTPVCIGNPPSSSCTDKWHYATMANCCLGVIPPRPILGRSLL
jgi:hypothetical protein